MTGSIQFEPLLLSSGKHDLIIEPPVMNSAGILGFGGLSLPFPMDQLGAFVTNPVSLNRRTPASGVRTIHTSGGIILHTGLPNIGIGRTMSRYRDQWARFSRPIILHTIVETSKEMEQIVAHVENENAIAAIEIGLQRTADTIAAELVHTASLSQLPILVRVPLDTGLHVVEYLESAGAGALVLGPPRGSVLCSKDGFISGRYYGASLLPLCLQTVRTLKESFSLPIIGGTGIFNRGAIESVFHAGASAIQLDTILWNQPERVLHEGVNGS